MAKIFIITGLIIIFPFNQCYVTSLSIQFNLQLIRMFLKLTVCYNPADYRIFFSVDLLWICFAFNFTRVMTSIRYIRVNFHFGPLDCVRYNKDLVIPGFITTGALLHTFHCNFCRAQIYSSLFLGTSLNRGLL